MSGSALDALIRSGIWASLTPAQCKILPVLDTFADTETQTTTISYRGMMRYAGVGSQSTVATALKRFQALRFLRVEPRTNDEGFRACSAYKLCFHDPEFLQLADSCRQSQKEQIDQEREIRRQEREKRKAATRRVFADTREDAGMRGVGTVLPEQGPQAPSPAPDLIPAEADHKLNRDFAGGAKSAPLLPVKALSNG
jgi:hypothetical protein